MRNIDVLHKVREERSILCTLTRRKANWIGSIWCRSGHLKHFIEGKLEIGTEGTETQGRVRKRLLDGLKGRGGYWKLKETELVVEEAMDLS